MAATERTHQHHHGSLTEAKAFLTISLFSIALGVIVINSGTGGVIGLGLGVCIIVLFGLFGLLSLAELIKLKRQRRVLDSTHAQSVIND